MIEGIRQRAAVRSHVPSPSPVAGGRTVRELPIVSIEQAGKARLENVCFREVTEIGRMTAVGQRVPASSAAGRAGMCAGAPGAALL